MPWRSRPLVLAVASLVAVVLAGVMAGPAGAATATSSATHPPQLGFALRASGFGQAVLVTSAHDGSGRLYVLDKVGRITSYVPGSTAGHLYLDLRSKVNSSGTEQGLLGLAFYPDFVNHPRFYVAYTRSDGALQISRFMLPGATVTRVNPAIEQQLFAVPHPTYTNHNAGMLAFGRDLDLLISTGDGGGAGDPFAHAQSIASLSGKILRIDIRRACTGHAYYCIPSDNPYVGVTGARGEIWDIGLRNPWRFSVDPPTGNVWIGDVGQDRYEEVDEALLGSKGLNFGWSCREGNAIYNASRCRTGVHYTAPLAVIAHPTAEALIGGLVYRGSKYAAVLGPRYIFGDYITGTVWTMPATAGGTPTVAGHLTQLTSFGTDEHGEVWTTALNGRLYQMSAHWP